MTRSIRQGDVLLIPTRKRPSAQAKVVTDQGRTILAYGEVTGHSHEVVAFGGGEAYAVLYQATEGTAARVTHSDDRVPAQQLFQEPDGTRLLVIQLPCALRHQEHDPAALDAGVTYQVVRQCEWDAEQIRRVAD